MLRGASRSLPLRPGTRRLCLPPSLVRHVDALAARHRALEREMEGGEDAAAFSLERVKELARLAPVAAAHVRLTELSAERAELRELASDTSSERELRELAREELALSDQAVDGLRAELVELLVPPAEGEEAPGALIEVRPGVGGLEAGLFAGEVFDMYERLARRRRWRFELHGRADLDQGGVREASASITGDGAFAALRTENGVHRVQRVPATESLGRVHTSTAVVMVLPQVGEGEAQVEVHEADVKVEVFRSSGAGGQHVNTTESAVRLTHLPTGIKVSCQNERSQHQNRAQAFKALRARVAAHEAQAAREAQEAQRSGVASTGARNERIRTYNYADDRVTDHRIGLSKFGVPRMLEGVLLDELIDDLVEHGRQERVEEYLRDLATSCGTE